MGFIIALPPQPLFDAKPPYCHASPARVPPRPVAQAARRAVEVAGVVGTDEAVYGLASARAEAFDQAAESRRLLKLAYEIAGRDRQMLEVPSAPHAPSPATAPVAGARSITWEMVRRLEECGQEQLAALIARRGLITPESQP